MTLDEAADQAWQDNHLWFTHPDRPYRLLPTMADYTQVCIHLETLTQPCRLCEHNVTP